MSVCRYIACLLVALFSVLPQASQGDSHVVVHMRDSGYTMGDTIAMTATFTLKQHQTIDEDSLPLAGRVKPWLDIQTIHLAQSVKHDQKQVKLTVNWQIFATVEIAQQLKTPEIILKTLGEQAEHITIPAQSFYYSPVFPLPPLKALERRANLTPPSDDATWPRFYFSVCLVLFTLCAFVWLWLKDLLPWLPYQPGPMTKLLRQLNVHKHATRFSQAQLRGIHTALNQSASVSLYPDNLLQLFSHAPYFKHEKKAVTAFFHQSWQVFYADKSGAENAVNVADTLRWIRQVALAERLFKRRKPAC